MNYPHLSPKAKEQLKHSDIERIEYIRSPRWIGYPQAQQVLVKLEDLLSNIRPMIIHMEMVLSHQ